MSSNFSLSSFDHIASSFMSFFSRKTTNQAQIPVQNTANGIAHTQLASSIKTPDSANLNMGLHTTELLKEMEEGLLAQPEVDSAVTKLLRDNTALQEEVYKAPSSHEKMSAASFKTKDLINTTFAMTSSVTTSPPTKKVAKAAFTVDKVAEKGDETAKPIIKKLGALQLKEFARGKAKVILSVINRDAKNVYIIATSPQKVKEIQEEAELHAKINAILKDSPEDLKHLATDIEVSAARIEGQPTYIAGKADGDLEGLLAGKIKDKETGKTISLSLQKEISLFDNMLDGIASLHKAGFIHDDVKMDNFLYYGGELKVADLGKHREIHESPGKTEVFVHKGNPRNAAFENLASKKADVFSVGVVGTRMFENSELTEDKPMMKAPTRSSGRSPDTKRKGMELFLTENADCPQKENASIGGKIKVVAGIASTATFGPSAPEDFKKAEGEVHSYIDAVITARKEKNPDNAKQLDALGNLLKNMTSSDPRKRPDAAKAREQLRAIDWKF